MSLVHALTREFPQPLYRPVVLKHVRGRHKLICNLTLQVGAPRGLMSEMVLLSRVLMSSRAKGLDLRV